MPLILPMIRLAALLVVGVSLFAAPNENSKAAQVRGSLKDLKATVAQLQNQIIALESTSARPRRPPLRPRHPHARR